jgi:hypothetical protein
MINHKPNSDFKSRIIIGGTQEGLLELLVSMFQQNAKKMNSRKCQLHWNIFYVYVFVIFFFFRLQVLSVSQYHL